MITINGLTLEVGMPITEARVYEALPVGSTIRGAYTWVKHDDQRWHRQDQPHHINDTPLLDGSITIVSIGDGGFPVGRVLNEYDEFGEMPVGTIFGPSEAECYIKVGDDVFRRCDITGTNQSNTYEHSAFSTGGYNRVLGYYRSGAVAPPTIDQFMWQFRETTLYGAEQHGISMDVVNAVFQQLGVDKIGPAKGARVKARRDLDAVPEGTRVYVGSPAHFSTYALWVKREGEFVRMMGDGSTPYGASPIIDEIPGVADDWPTQQATPEDEAAIAEFKSNAWRLGWQAKQAQRWCSAFENIMADAGITEADLIMTHIPEGQRPGDRVNPQTAALMPEGSIFRYEVEPGQWVYYVRQDAGTTNRARTRRLFSTHEGAGHYATGMEVVIHNSGDYTTRHRLPNMTDALWNALPRGVLLSPPGEDNNIHVMCDDHHTTQWVASPTQDLTRGNWTRGQYGNPSEFDLRGVLL